MDEVIKVVIAVALIASVIWLVITMATNPIQDVGENLQDRGEQTSSQGQMAICNQKCQQEDANIPSNCYDLEGFTCNR